MPYKKKEGKLFKKSTPRHYKKNSRVSSKIMDADNEIKPDKIIEGAASAPAGVLAKEKPISSKKSKALPIIGIIITVIALIAAGIFAYFLLREDTNGDIPAVTAPIGDSANAAPRIVVPDEFFAESKYDFTYVEGMKAVKLVPKKDFMTGEQVTEESVGKEIDSLIADIGELQFNSIIVDTRYDQRVIYKSSVLESTDFDVLQLLIEKAKAAKINVMAVYHLNGVKSINGELISTHLSYDCKELLYQAASELPLNYELLGILLDDYYVQKNADAYKSFVEYGAVGNYDEWLRQNTATTIDEAVEAIHAASNSMPTGLLIKDVWANQSQNEQGTPTKADYSALIDGYADTKGIVESKKIDFINVEIDTSLYDNSVPFNTVASWWDAICKKAGLPLYVTHNTANANAAGAGTDQLARQVSKTVSLNKHYGNAFTDIDVMMNHMNDSTDILMKYYQEEYSVEDLFKDLKVTLPEKRNVVTYEENIQFRGKFDPNQEVFLNGEKIIPTEREGFSVWVPLEVGKNVITLEHKGKKVIYNVERKVIILKKVSPTEDMTVSGSSQVEVNVMAYQGSKITATLNGQTITLVEGGAGDDNVLDSAYVNMQGTFTVPRAGAKEQNIGKITINGSYKGYTASAAGANITVDKIPDEVDPDEATGQILQHAVVNMRYANTYPYNTTPGYPQAILYQLPMGTQDIVQSINGDFVNLRSGKTVKMGAVSLQDIAFEGNNAITEFSAGVEGDDTVIRSTFNWKAPFSIMPNPYPTDQSQTVIYSFASNTVEILFDYTTRVDKERFVADVSSSPIFSSITHERVRNEARGIWQYKVTLTLQQTGRYYGCHAEYEGNTLVLRFNHPPSSGSLSGLKIAVDPGHGGSKVGTTAGSDVLEKEINMLQAWAVKDSLEARGAQVLMIRESDVFMDEPDRVDMAEAHGCDLYISVHHNSAGANSAPTGVQTYYNAPFSQPLAKYVQAQLEQVFGATRWNWYKSSVPSYNFIVTREKQFPSILVEFGYLSNRSDEARAQDAGHRAAMAEALAQGVVDYYSAYN